MTLQSVMVFFFKQKTAYEMRISDWSSDVCSSDLCVDPCEPERSGIDFGHRHRGPGKKAADHNRPDARTAANVHDPLARPERVIGNFGPDQIRETIAVRTEKDRVLIVGWKCGMHIEAVGQA